MIIKDVTVGILLMVIAIFPLSIAGWYLTPVEWWVSPLVYVLIISFHYIFGFGWDLAFKGIKVDVDKK